MAAVIAHIEHQAGWTGGEQSNVSRWRGINPRLDAPGSAGGQ